MRRKQALAAAALVLLFCLAGLFSGLKKSATADEFAHLAAGVRAWKTLDFSLYSRTPPWGRMALTWPALFFHPRIALPLSSYQGINPAWKPWIFGTDFLALNRDKYQAMLAACRAAALFGFGVLCLLAARESRRLYGEGGAFVTLLACAGSPTLLAHGRLVTTDVPAAAMVLILAIAARRYLERPDWRRAFSLGAAAGTGLLVKFSLLLFAGLSFLLPWFLFFLRGRERKRGKYAALLHPALALAAGWLVVSVGYLGRDLGFHEQLRFESRIMRAEKKLARLAPLPLAFVQGLDRQLADAEGGEFRQGNYLFGRWYSGRRWFYFPLALLLKEPVPLLGMAAVSIFLFGLSKPVPRKREEALYLFFAGFYFAAACLFGSLQIGVRYLIPCLPLVYIVAGRAGKAAFEGLGGAAEKETAPSPEAEGEKQGEPGEKGGGEQDGADPDWKQPGPLRTLRLSLVLFGLWLVIDHIMIWPHYLAYFNAFAGGPRQGYKLLLDSNLDWGQDLPGLRDWMKKNGVERIDLAYFGHDDPDRFGIRFDLPGERTGNRYLAVSANYLMGREYPMTFLKLRRAGGQEKAQGVENPFGLTRSELGSILAEVRPYRRKKPAAVIGYSIFVFEKTPSMNSGEP